MTSVAAIDLGAQSGRVALGRFDGERLESTVVHRFSNDPVRVRGTLFWDILRLYRDVLDGLRVAGGEVAVASVGVDSWAVDFGLLDRRGKLVQNPVHYRDQRRARAFDLVLDRVPARELYERTGIQVLPINTVFELSAMAVEHDEALDAAETLLLIPDLIHYWLGGSPCAEFTNATTTQLLDARTGDWAHDLTARLGIRSALLPGIVRPGAALGDLGADVREDTRLSRSGLVAVASHDTASAVAAIPLIGPGSVYISAGTWSLVGMELEEPLIDESTLAGNLSNEGGVEGSYRLLRNVTGLWLLHECRRVWALARQSYSFDELLPLAAAAPALRSFVDPNDPVFSDPGDMPARVQNYCFATGQPRPESVGEIVRCILESLALKHAQAVRALGAVTGTAPSEVHIVGGGARNELLCRWTADATGLPVLAGAEDSTLLGNLLVQLIALGEIGSIAEAREVVRASFPATRFEPVDSPEWEDARQRFEAIGVPDRPWAAVVTA